MKTRGSIYNARYWLNQFEMDLSKVKKFLENVDESTPEFTFVEQILTEYIHKKEKSIEQKKEYLGIDNLF